MQWASKGVLGSSVAKEFSEIGLQSDEFARSDAASHVLKPGLTTCSPSGFALGCRAAQENSGSLDPRVMIMSVSNSRVMVSGVSITRGETHLMTSIVLIQEW